MNDQQPVFSIEKIYVKDVSLEAPNSPQVFLEQVTPQVEVQLRNAAARVKEALFEVSVTVTVTAKAGERTYFLVEASQAGIFQIRNVPEADLDPILGIACANILFPYARETIADLISRAGFPPIHLAPVNFEAMYAAAKQAESHRRPSRRGHALMRVVLAIACGFASFAAHAEFRSIAEPAVLYDAPSVRASKLYVVSRNLPVEVISTDGAMGQSPRSVRWSVVDREETAREKSEPLS